MGIDDWHVVSRKKHGYRSYEDDVAKISISIYVSNLPETFSAKDLFHACNKYGHVVDSFIPLKRSKEGKRFGFVKFINVSNVERLVGNLCTVWVGRYKLQANKARFGRPPLNGRNIRNSKSDDRHLGGFKEPNVRPTNGNKETRNNSFASVLKSNQPNNLSSSNMIHDSSPAIALDDDCLSANDLSCVAIGKIKDINALSNLSEEFLLLCGIPNSFVKDNATISDYFVAVRGTWLSTATKVMFLSIYAPQDIYEKKSLWEYITHIIDTWDGECIILGDFMMFDHKQGRKAKVRWGHLKGDDEISKFFIGIINKKDAIAIRGVSIDGDWIDDLARWMTWSHDFVNAIREFFIQGYVLPGNRLLRFWLPNRLKMVISELISDVQSAFVSNRQILDGPFILNELISWCKAHKSKAMIFKVDFEKAFDSSTAEFNSQGLKQGDLISYCVILVMESLHLSFNNIINADLFKGIRFDDSLTLSHLFYADDAVFIGKWDRANILTIVRMLKCFFLASGLQINILKSKLMGIGVSNEVEVICGS
ncbi:RNA-directed DNA polymerase, eukaryota [Tanacetum coccineum]